MKLWRSLRWRLAGSYLVLALILLSFAGYIFSNALSLYASIVQRQQLQAYADQAQAIIADARRQGQSPDQALAARRRRFLRPALPAGGRPARALSLRPAHRAGQPAH